MHTLERAVFHVERLRAIALLLLITTFASACVVSRSPVTGNKRAYGYTWEQEVQLGKQADQQVMQQFALVDDANLNQYVQGVAQNVLANSRLRQPDTPAKFKNTPFTFRILDSPVVNAFALPGGYVYVTRGLLTHLENEAQLAVVLGHEIGHVAARHASQQALQQQLGQLGVVGGAILGGVVLGPQAAQNILNLGSQAAQLLFLSYSRDAEREADQLGVEDAELTGYEASSAADFFETLKRLDAKQGALPTFLSTHPDPGEREQTVRQLDAEWDMKVQANTLDRAQFLQHLDGVVLGENPREGFVENGTFYHPELRFQFPVPQGFSVINEASLVALVAPNQQAVEIFQIAQGSSAQAAASQFANQQGIQVIENGPTRSSGQPAYYVVAQAQTQDGQTVELIADFIEYGNRVYSFLGYTTPQLFPQYQNAFLQAARGFAPLTDPRILNIQPARVNIVAASRTAPFSTFVPQNLPPGMSAQDLAVLNQVDLGETIQEGTLLKLPAR
ncbi:MAG TPA: M48 family metalloprotease [Rhodothermales bacterium]|nr:M48 family metalloprotease [Rhodothermales bacterium]